MNLTVYQKVQNTRVSLEKRRCDNWFLSHTRKMHTYNTYTHTHITTHIQFKTFQEPNVHLLNTIACCKIEKDCNDDSVKL